LVNDQKFHFHPPYASSPYPLQTELAEHAKQYVDSLSSVWPRVVVHGIKGGTDPAGEAQKTGQDLVPPVQGGNPAGHVVRRSTERRTTLIFFFVSAPEHPFVQPCT